MPELNIFIPSYKRSGGLKGVDYFKSAKYVVPESQKEAYAKVVGADRVIPLPDDQDGNLCRKRNWILRNLPRPLVMIDDDVKSIMMTEGVHEVKGKDHAKATERIALTWEQAEAVLIEGFNLAHQLGCVYWGINKNTDGRNYQQYKPFSMTVTVCGPFQAHLEHDLFYDERMDTKDDFDFSLQVLNKYRKLLRFNKFAYDCDHADNAGGCVSERTFEKELALCRAIEKKWGRGIIKYPIFPKKMPDILNGSVNIPIAGV